ncbi:MAG: diadenylate cyclase CdaA [Rhodothermales bacterium]
MTLFGFIPVRLIDLLEIGLGAYVLYRLYQFMRGTIAVQIFLGLGALYLVRVGSEALDMTMFPVIFGAFSEVFLLAVIVLFQPEIRRVLLLIGQNPLVRRLVRKPVQDELVAEIAEAVQSMSTQRIGALIAFERGSGLRSYVETGTPVNATLSCDLLVTIFFAQNPLHDGAVIINNGVIEAARCILPVSTTMKLSTLLGLRHRAAVGLSEQTDAFVVVVSEETGRISIAEGGTLTQVQPDEIEAELKRGLTANVMPPAPTEV